MISVAAHSVGGIVDVNKPGAAVLPPVTKLDFFSETVAVAAANEAKKEGLNRKDFNDATACVKACKWVPEYK